MSSEGMQEAAGSKKDGLQQYISTRLENVSLNAHADQNALTPLPLPLSLFQ